MGSRNKAKIWESVSEKSVKKWRKEREEKGTRQEEKIEKGYMKEGREDRNGGGTEASNKESKERERLERSGWE